MRWPEARWLNSRRGGVVVLVVCLALAFVLSILRGMDANWDLQNYHLYNPFALIGGRMGIDMMPAGFQTFFNPLLDLPYYVLAHEMLPGWPRLVTGLAGLPYGVLAFLTWRISVRVLPGVGWSSAAVLIGVTGTTVVAEIGTSFGDIPTADLLLGGLLCVLAGLPSPRPSPLWGGSGWGWRALAAGALSGAALGLKPTNAVFMIALFLALTVPQLRRPRQALAAAILFGLGALAGLILTDGWWAVTLYRAFGNPVAPFLNTLFHSEWFPRSNFVDTTYLPRSALQAIFYPFFWLTGRSFVVAEISFRDARFAAAYLAIAGLVLTAVAARRDLRTRLALAPAATPQALTLLIFFVAGFVLWEAGFSIIRYAVGLEALTGVVLLLGLRVLSRLLPRRRAAWVSGAVVVFVLGFGNYADWGRIRRTGATVFDAPEQPLPPRSLVVLTGAPRGFIALFLNGPEMAFIGMAAASGGNRMWTEAQRRIADHTGPIFLVNNVRQPVPDLTPWGLRQSAAPCTPLPNAYQTGLELCPAERIGPA